MNELTYQAFDADNHYYEALDAFTRHLDPKLGPRCVQWAEIDGRKYHVVGGQVSRAVVNPTFDPIAKAGAMHDYFRGNPDQKQPWEFLVEREPIPAAYRDRDARLAQLDEFDLEAVWLFPTLGVLYEELLKARRRRGDAHVHRVQPLARRGLGLQLPRPHLRRALRLVVRHRLGDLGARVGDRSRRALHRDAARGRRHGRRFACR